MKKTIAVLVSVFLLVSVLVPVNKLTVSAADVSKHYTYTYATVFAPDLSKDELYNSFAKKYNVEFEIMPLQWDNWSQKVRIFVASGDLPDVTFVDGYSPAQLRKLATSGNFKQLPNISKYKNLAALANSSETFKFESVNGKNYMWPNYTPNTLTKSTFTGMVLYRKDWAKEVGYNLSKVSIMKPDQLIKIAKDIIAKDPGKNGEGKTAGFASVGWGMPQAIMNIYNPYFNALKKVNGKYVWGASLPETTKGIKLLRKLLDEGVLYKDFYLSGNADAATMFKTGKLAFYYDNLNLDNINGFLRDFNSADGAKAADAVGITFLSDEKGKTTKIKDNDYWDHLAFSPKMEDAKLDRYFQLADWIVSDEGKKSTTFGIKNVDWKEGKNGKVELINGRWEKDSQGAYENTYLNNTWIWRSLASSAGDSYGLIDLNIPQYAKDVYKSAVNTVMKAPDAVVKTRDLELNKLETIQYTSYGAYKQTVEDEIRAEA